MPAPAAHGYQLVHGQAFDATNFNQGWAGSAGAMVSTVGDMEAWAPVLATGKGILTPSMQQQRLQMVPQGTPGATYGLGILSITGYLGHDGEVNGYNSFVLYQPQAKIAIVALATTSPSIDVPPQPTLEVLPYVATALVRALPPSATGGS